MSKMTEKIRTEVIEICDHYQKYNEEKDDFNWYNEHVRYVVKYGILLAKKYGADEEIVELATLLHDISMPLEIGDKSNHHTEGAKIAEQMLSKLDYPTEKIEKVQQCILNHRGSVLKEKNSIEEKCVADADAIAHFDCIPSLFQSAYGHKHMNGIEGAKSVKEKLERDFQKLSPETKEWIKERYETILKVLFVEWEE